MCICSPTNIAQRYCGLERSFQPAAVNGKIPPRSSLGFCRHPDFGTDRPPPTTVHPETGAWLEAHAREIDPPKTTALHPKVVQLHLGFGIEHLEKLVLDLKAARDGAVSAVFHHSLETLANTAALVAKQSAITMNAGRPHSTAHYVRLASKLEGVRRGLQRVKDVTTAATPPSAALLHQLAHLVENYVLPKAREAVHELHAPPSDVAGAHGGHSPLPNGEPF